MNSESMLEYILTTKIHDTEKYQVAIFETLSYSEDLENYSRVLDY